MVSVQRCSALREVHKQIGKGVTDGQQDNVGRLMVNIWSM